MDFRHRGVFTGLRLNHAFSARRRDGAIGENSLPHGRIQRYSARRGNQGAGERRSSAFANFIGGGIERISRERGSGTEPLRLDRSHCRRRAHSRGASDGSIARTWVADAHGHKRASDGTFLLPIATAAPAIRPGGNQGDAMRTRFGAVLILLSMAFTPMAHAQSLTETQLLDIRFDQKLGGQVSLDLPFHDETGKTVTLGDYFGKKPVILVLGYYQCPMLCTLTFNGMVEGMNDMKWSIGREFNVVQVSINPKETPELAAAKRKNYLKEYGRPEAAAG